VVEALRHHGDDRCEPALDFICYGERQHEFLAGRSCVLGRGEDAPEVVTRMTEAARRHVAVEKIDVAHETGVEECCLICGGLAAAINVHRPRARYSSNCSRGSWKGGPGSAAIAQPRLSRILRLKSRRISGVRCSGRAAAAKAAMHSTAERASLMVHLELSVGT
jgi:hypothetical protein